MAGEMFHILKLEENFSTWKRMIALCFLLNIDMVITIKEGYDFIVDEDNKMLPLSMLMKKQKVKIVAYTKAKLMLEQVSLM